MITRVKFQREADESRILFRSHEKFILPLCLKITQNVFRKFKDFPQLDLLYLGIQIEAGLESQPTSDRSRHEKAQYGPTNN